MTRYGQVIRLRPELEDVYRKLHADAWPTVLATLTASNVRNYSIFHRDGYLFAYFEYDGVDYDADMARIAADPETQRWWSHCEPCQQPVETAADGEWWAAMDEVFHLD